MAVDMLFGGGSISGTATSTMPPAFGNGSAGPFGFTGSAFHSGAALRFGARLAMKSVALAAGAGIGGSMWITNAKLTGYDLVSDAFVPSPDGINPEWHVPLWTALTYKPSCSWGVQALAQYEVHPTSMDENAVSFGGGLLWQPSSACSEPPGLAVR
jgi:hypothetical protein